MKPVARTVVLALATAATAASLVGPPAQAYGGSSWGDGGSSYGDRDGTSSWDADKDYDWKRDYDWKDGRVRDRARTFSWDGKHHHPHQWTADKDADRVGVQAGTFETKQREVLDALNRMAAYLDKLADRILTSDLDPSVKARLLVLIEARGAAVTALIEQVEAATTLEDLKAIRWWSFRDYAGGYFS